MEMQGKTVKMHFTVPLMVEIDEVSNYMCVSFFIGKPHKKMRELEVVSLEPYYENDFKVFKSDKMRSFETTLWCDLSRSANQSSYVPQPFRNAFTIHFSPFRGPSPFSTPIYVSLRFPTLCGEN
jgi:hypothetical protein